MVYAENPVKPRFRSLPTDAIDRGAEMTATRDGVRGAQARRADQFMWCYASNTLINQHGDIVPHPRGASGRQQM